MIQFARGSHGVGSPETSDSERRHADQIKFGKVVEADYSTARVRVLIGDEDDDDGHLTTGWLPMPGRRAAGDFEWHGLEVGERVAVLSESGETQNGLVIPAGIYCDENPAPSDKVGHWIRTFKDGGVVEYDRNSGEFHVKAITKATIEVEDSTVVVDSSSITLTAGGVTLKVSSAGVEIQGGQVTHDGKNIGKTHTHGQVQPGGGVSGVPV